MVSRNRIHPGRFAVAEREKWYSEQAKQGWILARCGRFVDRFHRGVPGMKEFRIELTDGVPSGNAERLFAQRQEEYVSAGWRYVSGKGPLRVFTAPAGTKAPEFTESPAMQKNVADMLLLDGILCCCIGAAALVLPALIMFLSGEYTLPGLALDLLVRTGMRILFLCALVWIAVSSVYAGIRFLGLSKRIREGKGAVHAPQGGTLRVRRILTTVCFGLMAVCLVLFLGWPAKAVRQQLPMSADGPYLMLADLGTQGSRDRSGTESLQCLKTYRNGLFSDLWEIQECVVADGEHVVLRQRVYRTAAPFLAKAAAAFLAAETGGSYTETEVEGLDAAYSGSMECIAVKNGTVWHVRYLCFDGEDSAGKVLEALANR